MTTPENTGPVTAVVYFTVDPAQQQRLTDALAEMTEAVAKALPGFVSARLYRSLDGARVLSCTRWGSMDDYNAFVNHPDVRAFGPRVFALGQPDLRLYEVAHRAEAPPGGRPA